MLTFGSLFSGIGGFDLGFERAGMRCLWQCEIDKAARSVLRCHFPEPTLYTDVSQLSRPAPVDVLCGGFPCQDLSVAGRRAGLAGARSGLWHEFRRIAGEIAPRVIVIENVPGLLSSHQGRDFAALLQGLGELGYRFASRVLDSQYDRVAQRRRRVFVVGSLGDGSCAEILFEPESLCWDSAPRRHEAKNVAGTVKASVDRRRGSGIDPELLTYAIQAGAQRENLESGPDGVGVQAGIAYTLEARAEVQSVALARCVTAGEGKRGDWETCTLVTAPLTTRPYADHESKESLLVAATLRAGAGNGGKGHGARAGDKDENLVIAHTLRAEGFDASEDGTGRGVPLVSAFRTSPNCGAWETGERTDALTTGTDPSATVIVPTLRSNNRNNSSATAEASMHVQTRTGVRRLTPRECERLQAFPDDWTRWTDTGKEQADGPRYKQLGNAVTVTVVEWIGQRIVRTITQKETP